MWFRSPMNWLKGHSPRLLGRHERLGDDRRRRRPCVEHLEARMTPATILVDTFADVFADDGRTSLREALEMAADPVTHPGDDTILLPVEIGGVRDTYTLNPIYRDVPLLVDDETGRLTIQSSGGGRATIDAAVDTPTRFGMAIAVESHSDVEFRGLVITGGKSTDGGILGSGGGGIHNRGKLVVADCIIQDNASEIGGGILNRGASGVLTVTDSIIIDNVGEGIRNENGQVTIVNSSINVNRGTGIYSRGPLTMTDSTVSANASDGVDVGNADFTYYNQYLLLLKNRITHNGGHGVFVGEFFPSTAAGIVGLPDSGNVIAFNHKSGIAVTEANRGIAIRGNSIFKNVDPGIDLIVNGPSPNDPGDLDGGPNNLQNFPVLITAESDGSSTTVSGALNTHPHSIYIVDYYSSPPDGSDQKYLGAVSVLTDGNGNAQFTATFAKNVEVGWTVTATATTIGNAPYGDTSEFSPAIQLIAATPPNRLPVISSQSFSTKENSHDGTIVGAVVANDPDAGQTLSYQILAGNPNGAFAIDANTGRISVANSAAIDFETTSVFVLSVQVTDSGMPALSSAAEIAINVTNVNESPQIGAPAFPQAGLKNKPLAFSDFTGNAISISDPDASTTLLQVSLTVEHGTLTLGSTAGITFVTGSGNGDGTMTFQGTIAAINAALQNLIYQPSKGFVGFDTLQIIANDLGSNLGEPLFATDLISILVASSKK
jgi:hypothetical protein